jgi:hypothetical protein
MSQQELLAKVVRTLEQLEIEYMATGSIVSSLQGEPRSTHDIDIVVNLPRSKAQALADAFPSPDYFLDQDALLNAISGRGMANLMDITSGDKVDFWLLTETPFDLSRFARRYYLNVLGMRLAVSSTEDTILMKLRWAQMSGGSEKQFMDAVRVYEVQHEKLDHIYLLKWALELGIEKELDRLRNEAIAETQ